jgi:two-component system LytT family sensor kinase
VAAPNAAELLNLVGFVTGTVLYAMLLSLVIRDTGESERRNSLPLATALLGLAWNVGELAAYLLPRLGFVEGSVGLWAASFPALGLLAAVVVHSVAIELPKGVVVTVIAYASSAAASVLHAQTVFTGDPDASSLAFVLLTVSYRVIIVALAVMTRGQANGPRALWVLALALFAVSASHLGRSHGEGESWAAELGGHHASIPLAFAILYQDYRFALADLFLKRALTLLAMVAIAFAGYSVVGALPAGPMAAAALLGLWVTTGLLVPWLHARIVRFVDASLLGRPDYGVLTADISTAIAARERPEGVLDVVCDRLEAALNARRIWWTASDADGHEPACTADALLPTAEPPRVTVHVSELLGGRRLLSDDLALLDAVAAIGARRIDQLRLTSERYESQLREEEMLKLTAEAELKALRAQINPHFLFNALTTIGYLIETAPPRALSTLLQLTSLLREVLRLDGEFTTLGRELELIEHYLTIERERFEERLSVRIDVPAAVRDCRIPTLVLQPLVENAIKHGVAPSAAGGRVEVAAALIEPSALRVTVRNSGAPLTAVSAWSPEVHIGLDNVSRRLAGYYGDTAQFSLVIDSDGFTRAQIVMPFAVGRHDDEGDFPIVVAQRRERT